MDTEALLERSKKRISDLEKIPLDISPVDLDANITLSHGKDIIATNEISFESMCETFAAFIKTM